MSLTKMKSKWFRVNDLPINIVNDRALAIENYKKAINIVNMDGNRL